MSKRKIIAVITVLFTFILTATVAIAEHKLLPTDVLDAKQVEAYATYEYHYVKTDFTNSGGSGSEYYNYSHSTYSLGLGLGKGFEIKASIPYFYTRGGKREYNNGRFGGRSFYSEGSSSFDDFSVTGKYLILDEKKNPFSLAAGFGVKFNSASNTNQPVSSGDSTDFKPFLSASKKIGQNFIPYVSYTAYIRNNGDYQNHHSLQLGSEFKLSKDISLVPEIRGTFYNESNRVTSSQEYAVTLSSFIQTYKNLYLIPSVGISKKTTFQSRLDSNQYDPQYEIGGGLAIYYLW